MTLCENCRTISYTDCNSTILLSNVTHITMQRLRIFSLTLNNGGGTSPQEIHLMSSSVSDFERWVHGLSQVTSLTPLWGPPLSVASTGGPGEALPAFVVATCCRYHINLDVAAKVLQLIEVEPDGLDMQPGRFRLLCSSSDLDIFRSNVLWNVLRKQAAMGTRGPLPTGPPQSTSNRPPRPENRPPPQSTTDQMWSR